MAFVLKPGRKTIIQFMLFAGVGAIGTAGHYLTLIILVEFVGIIPSIATTIGFIVGAIINYILNYHITFKSTRQHREAITRFMLIALVGALLNTYIMHAGTTYTTVHYLIVQLVATGVVLLWNFILNKIWTFRSKFE